MKNRIISFLGTIAAASRARRDVGRAKSLGESVGLRDREGRFKHERTGSNTAAVSDVASNLASQIRLVQRQPGDGSRRLAACSVDGVFHLIRRFVSIILLATLSSFQQSALGQSDLGFQFVRVKYESVPWSRWNMWATDYPAAEQNLHTAIEMTTDIRLDGPPIVLELTDAAINEYPVLYLTEPGYWLTNDEEADALRAYLERGGFIIIDDFHDYPGRARRQWDNFYDNIRRVFPERELVELPADHLIWTVFFDIDPVAAPSTKPYFSASDDVYYAIYDDNGRMMVIVCYNQDIGDGWEWPDRNASDESSVSFQMAINFIVYALSH